MAEVDLVEEQLLEMVVMVALAAEEVAILIQHQEQVLSVKVIMEAQVDLEVHQNGQVVAVAEQVLLVALVVIKLVVMEEMGLHLIQLGVPQLELVKILVEHITMQVVVAELHFIMLQEVLLD